MSKNDKSAKFKELARSRVNRSINMIRLIANLGNKTHYDYTPEQARKIVNALQSEVNNVKTKFNSKREVLRNLLYEYKSWTYKKRSYSSYF